MLPDGYIHVESKLGSGTTFYIYLPASLRKSPPVALQQDQLITGNGTILLMDDEEIILKSATLLLNRLGYNVKVAKSGKEAIEIYKNSKHSFQAVILDLTIPGEMGGKETIQQLLKIDPDVKALVSSGYSNDPIMADFKKHGFKNVISKPYRIKELGEALQQALEN